VEHYLKLSSSKKLKGLGVCYKNILMDKWQILEDELRSRQITWIQSSKEESSSISCQRSLSESLLCHSLTILYALSIHPSYYQTMISTYFPFTSFPYFLTLFIPSSIKCIKRKKKREKKKKNNKEV
jgi:hypothetical protein